MPIIDANVILRYLLNDHPSMSEVAKETIISGAQTTAEVLAEVVYVLKGVYQVDRSTIAETLESLIQEISIPNKLVIAYACRLYGKTSLDFVDCIRFTQKAPTNGVVRGAFFETFVHFRDSAK